LTIKLSGDREQIVRSFIEDGRFTSEDEVIDEALRLLQERDEQAKLEALRRDVAIGVEQADRGELAPFDPQATLRSVRSRETAARTEPR
jgi:antitoxin ParD1/3/4